MLNKIPLKLKYFALLVPTVSFVTGILYSIFTSKFLTPSTKSVLAAEGVLNNFVSISSHNLLIYFLIIISGISIYIINTINISFNFFIFGASIANQLLSNNQHGLLIYAHALFEVPELMICYYISLYLSYLVLCKLRNNDIYFFRSLKLVTKLIFVSVLLLLAGAFTESIILNLT